MTGHRFFLSIDNLEERVADGYSKGMRKYGLPYMGSKTRLADAIIRLFPKSDKLWDVFCGGGAVAHCAVQSGKFKAVHVNDILPGQAEAVKAMIEGTLEVPKMWVSHEDFFRIRKDNPLIRIIWGFGNDGHSYLYSREIEPWKKACYYARMFNDHSFLREMGIAHEPVTRDWIRDNIEYCKDKYLEYIKPKLGITPEAETEYNDFIKAGVIKDIRGLTEKQHVDGLLKKKAKNADAIHSLMLLENIKNLNCLKALECMERIQSMERIKGNCKGIVTSSELDYRELTSCFDRDDVVYLDIPYENTGAYGLGLGLSSGRFDYEAFWEWVRKLPCIAVTSSYEGPDDFITLCEFSHRSLISDKDNKDVVEKCFLWKGHEKVYREKTGWHKCIRDKEGQIELF